MPHISWQEVSDLRHILIGATNKMKKGGAFKEAQYTQGVVSMLNDLIEKHQDDEK